MEMKIFLLVTILVTTFLVPSTGSTLGGHCKCRLSWTGSKLMLKYYENDCTYDHKPSYHLSELPSIDLGLTNIVCKCRCTKIKKEFALKRRHDRITKSGANYDLEYYTRIN